jgi:hypothetical protein
MHIMSKTARDAALKATSKGHTLLCIVDVELGKIHIYNGVMRQLTSAEMTSFTALHNITHKPIVQKMAYRNMNMRLTSAMRHEVLQNIRELIA